LPLPHGESSWFQAYIEGGIVGLLLRLLPFILLLKPINTRGYWIRFTYGISLLICCSVAPLFAAYGVQCTLGFLAGIANRRDQVRL
jgi:hypothetical protein